MKKYFLFSILISGLFLLAGSVSANMECGVDPIYDRDMKGEVKSAVWVRDWACVEGSKILATLQTGQVVRITGYTDGWYRVVAPNGETGWSGETFFTITDKSLTPNGGQSNTATTTSTAFANRLKGYILLQVESYGEAWYLNPTDSKRYYMKDGPVAYNMMRKFGLGITNSDLAKLQAGNLTLVNRLKGRIVLQVENHGEAYYINPKDGKTHYMADGAAAYQIMRNLSLGITNSDLDKIASGEMN